MAAVLSHHQAANSGHAPKRHDRVGPALDELVARVDTAGETTADALVKVRAALDEVQRASQTYVSDLRAAMVAVAGDDSTSLEAIFARWDTAVGEYVRSVESEAALQHELAQRAADQCSAILTSARHIAKVAYLTKILSLNAAAKAAAMKDSGGLSVIVQQISRLTLQTTVLAAQAVAAATRLVDLLPAIARSASELLSEANAFSARFRASVETLRPDTAQLQQALTADLARADTRLREIVELSGKARVALDFEKGFMDGLESTRNATSTLFALCSEAEALATSTQWSTLTPSKTSA